MADYADIALVAEKDLDIPYNEALDIMKRVRFIPFYEDSVKEIYRNYANDYVETTHKDFHNFNEMIQAYLDYLDVDKTIIFE